MSTQISPQIRIIALIGLLAAAALGAGMFLLSRPQAPSSAAEPLPRLTLKVSGVATPPAAKKQATPAAKGKPLAAAKPAPKRKPAVARNGLPIAIAEALTAYSVVVVSLSTGDAAVDGIARAEARAGASDARAGFVALNTLEKRQSQPLALKTGVVEAPAVLIFRRPGTVVLHIDGFADRLTVAQAATDARP
ncbi:MAG: hypothetical protein ACRDN6_11550 [Gaiellaceae bacterium]